MKSLSLSTIRFEKGKSLVTAVKNRFTRDNVVKFLNAMLFEEEELREPPKRS